MDILNFWIIDPDKNPDPEAAAQFQAIDKAYKILSDPKTRSTYDQLGARGMKTNASFTISIIYLFILAADAMRRMNEGRNFYFLLYFIY